MTSETGAPHGAGRVLIVEDEYFIAQEVAEAARAAGLTVVGPVASVDAASNLLDAGDIDAVVLDINLKGRPAFALADRLERDGVPYVIASGYGDDILGARFDGRRRFEKPYDPRRIADMIGDVIAAEREDRVKA